MSGILCLKWNNHTSTFIKTLDNLRSKELYCDATIACHGKYYPVHRFVLTTCSEYFEDIFERTQCKHPFIIVKDVEEIQLEALLNYMYKGEVNVLQDRLPALIKAAEALKVKGLAVPEDDLEECSTSPPKEKRKSSLCSSPLEPKPKKRSDKRVSEDSQSDSKDDEITEIVTHKSTSSKRTRDLKRSRDSKSRNAGDKNLRYQNSSPLKGNVTSDKNSQGEEIKIEPNEIFETVDEEFPPNSMEADPESIQQEESLFVSLLSPNNVQSVLDEDLGTGDEGTSQDLPQCSSWSDDVNTNSEKIQDDDIVEKSQWLNSEEFDHLTLDPYPSYLTNEEESTNFSSNASNESSVLSPNQTVANLISNRNDPSKSSISKLQSAASTSFELTEQSEETIPIELLPKIKEEVPSLESLGFEDTSPSALEELSKFHFPDCPPNYASILGNDSSGYEPQGEKLEGASADSLAMTISTGTGSKTRFHCTVCAFNCKDKTALKLHIMRKHTGEKPYSCAFCNYRCTTNDMLKIHTRKHTGERPFSCPYCSCRMSVKSSLKRHILLKHILAIDDIKIEEQDVSCEPSEHFLLEDLSLIDTGKRPKGISQCPLCSYKTKYKTNMKTHIARKHAESLPFECSWCKYKSSTKESLKIHMRRHTGEKPYKCKFCPYKAAHYNSIKLHNNIHTSNKPFRCRQCPYKAAQKSSLYNHMRQHESN